MLNGMVAPVVVTATVVFDNALKDAIHAAKSTGMPQGTVIALLHAHALQQTQELFE
jgi:hypothetical protein